MNFDKLAKQILDLIGGEKNIDGVTHCMTRLRFTLRDPKKANKEAIKQLQGILGIVEKGGQTQVIIGNDVAYVYKALLKLGNFSTDETVEKTKKSIPGAVIDTIIGIFSPIVPALIGAGMVKAVLAILVAFGLSKDSQNYYIINFISDGVFYFMPMLLAFSAAQKFKCNPYLAVGIAAVLVHPNLSALVTAQEPVALFSMPIKLVNYANSTIPIILIIWFMSYIESLADKYSPKVIKVILKPLLVILITAPVALIVLGPIGSVLSDGFATFVSFLQTHTPFLIPTLMGAFMPLMVSIGMHVSLTPLASISLAASGTEIITGPGMLASNIAQAGACFAVAFRTKNKDMRQLATSSGITSLCGVTEPALYGVTLKLKRPLIAVIIAGGIAGFFAGVSGLVRYSFGTPGLPTLPVFIGEDPSNIIKALVTVAIAFIAAFIITLILGFDKGEEQLETKPASTTKAKDEKYVITSPIKGSVTYLSDVQDEMFASEVMGKGIAIEPVEGKVYAPTDGEIITMFKTKHAIGMKTTQGVEILIHVGIDTVKLNGEHFTSHVKDNQLVKKGDLLLEFDIEAINKAGYQTITPVIITNTMDFTDVIETDKKNVTTSDQILEII